MHGVAGASLPLLVGPHLVLRTVLTIRRLHKMECPGWWAALGLIPLLVILLLCVLALFARTCWAVHMGSVQLEVEMLVV